MRRWLRIEGAAPAGLSVRPGSRCGNLVSLPGRPVVIPVAAEFPAAELRAGSRGSGAGRACGAAEVAEWCVSPLRSQNASPAPFSLAGEERWRPSPFAVHAGIMPWRAPGQEMDYRCGLAAGLITPDHLTGHPGRHSTPDAVCPAPDKTAHVAAGEARTVQRQQARPREVAGTGAAPPALDAGQME